MNLEPEVPVTREFRLFTAGREPGIDAISIMCEVLKDLSDNERSAALFYIADKHGFAITPKRS